MYCIPKDIKRDYLCDQSRLHTLTPVSAISSKVLDCTNSKSCAVEDVYRDHPGHQEHMVTVDRWSSYRHVSVYLRLCTGYFESVHLS